MNCFPVFAIHSVLAIPLSCLGVAALRGRGPLLVNRPGVVTAYPVSLVGHGAWRFRSARGGFGTATKVSASALMSSSLTKPPSARC
jgi:hypothetical protein